VLEHLSEIDYRLRLSDIAHIIPNLQECNLTCVLSLPYAGEVWREVEQQILEHLRSQDISVGLAPNRNGNNYFTSPIFLVHPTKGRQSSTRLFVEADLTASTFTVAELNKKSQLVNNPMEGSRYRLLFFGRTGIFVSGPGLTFLFLQRHATVTYAVRLQAVTWIIRVSHGESGKIIRTLFLPELTMMVFV
jgi:hypothetical protein